METKLYTVTIPTLGVMPIYFDDVSLEVIDIFEKTKEFERQKDIKHLGLISTVLEGSSHSRYDYVMKQCALVGLVGQLHAGNPNLSLGSIKIDGVEFKGDALLKSWFLLSNFGHTKFTYGDEKALILHAIKNPKFKRKLIKPISDEVLKRWCKEVIDEFDYSNMHYVLSIRRIYKETSGFPKKREKLLLILKLLLIDKELMNYKVNIEKLEQLKRLFEVIRKLSIISIDAHYSHLPITLDLIASILSLRNIENSYHNDSLISQTDPFISLLHDELYLNINVLEAQRNYEIEAQKKTLGNSQYSIDEILNKSFNEGLILERKNRLKHFLRLKIEKNLQTPIEFILELRKLSIVRTGCRDTDYNIDHHPLNGTRYIDFFIDDEQFTSNQLPPFIYNICNYIEEISNSLLIDRSNEKYYQLNNQMLESAENGEIPLENLLLEIKASAVTSDVMLEGKDTEEIINLYRKTVWAILRYVISPRYFWDVDIKTKEYPQFTTFDGKDPEIKKVLEQAISIEGNNEDRAHELKQIKKSLAIRFDGIILVSMARIKVYDSTMPPNKRLVTDIDGLVVKVNKEKLIIEFHEAKNKRNAYNAARKDLNDKFIGILNKDRIRYRIKEVKDMGAKLVVTFNNSI